MRPAVGLLLFYKEKSEENENMKNYKIAVAGTGYEPPHIVRTVQKRGLQGVEQANQRLAWRSESGARPVFVWSRSWL